MRSSPAVSNGRVYIGSNDGGVYCLNGVTGALLWHYSTGSDVPSSPTVFNERVYIGSYDSKIYCFNASTGAILWTYTTGGLILSSPAIMDGKVYVGSYDHNIYCLNASNGELLWSYEMDGAVYSSPSVSGQRVYVGSKGRYVYCLNASTGILIWKHDVGYPILSSPAVYGGMIYIGSGEDRHMEHQKRDIYCLNASTGTLIWNFTTGSFVESSPAVASGNLYVGSNDGKIYCFNASTGSKLWSYSTGGRVYSSPAIVNGTLYVGSEDKKIYAIAQDTLAPYWLEALSDLHISYGEPLSYQLNATDPNGIDTWWLNDTSVFTIDSTGLILNTTPLQVGNYPLEIKVNDTFGNTLSGIIMIKVLIIDTNPPTLYFVDVRDKQTINATALFTLTVYAYDAESGIAEVEIGTDPNNRLEAARNSSNTHYYYVTWITSNVEGTHKFCAYAVDNEGNGRSVSITLTIIKIGDGEPPTLGALISQNVIILMTVGLGITVVAGGIAIVIARSRRRVSPTYSPVMPSVPDKTKSQLEPKPVKPAVSEPATIVAMQAEAPSISPESQRVLDAIRAYGRLNRVPFSKLASVLDIPESRIETLLIGLIGAGLLTGYLEKGHYHRPKDYRIQCQMCDKVLLNPPRYKQCDQCYRFICDDCSVHVSGCPTHPQAPGELISMPKRCGSCNTLYTDLRELKGQPSICPACGAPL
ncbi:MAG: beta-alanine-activating enzyme beta-propeller domain-containing protein [Candidatus Ranarchaeia archaeon]